MTKLKTRGETSGLRQAAAPAMAYVRCQRWTARHRAKVLAPHGGHTGQHPAQPDKADRRGANDDSRFGQKRQDWQALHTIAATLAVNGVALRIQQDCRGPAFSADHHFGDAAKGRITAQRA
ncbi:hypothetical protein [Gemmobacter sp. LW-1]|uniref:hypothetical protein n=1 Tax=Gemmobacter sp. LW-1 TaxID=1529005 RepID=UPI00128EF02F|nr:hypothetical protein [Gemmobacter sp. LW-1]